MVGFENDSDRAIVFSQPQWWFAEKICLKNGQGKSFEGEETFGQATAEQQKKSMCDWGYVCRKLNCW